jgi:hypothetical protein
MVTNDNAERISVLPAYFRGGHSYMYFPVAVTD